MIRNLWLQTFCVVVVFAAGCSKVAPPPGPLVIPRAASAPVLDAKLDDACWQGALLLKDFTLAECDNVPAKATVARVTFDNAALYVACECAVPVPGELRAAVIHEHDGAWSDDSIQVFVRTRADFLQFDQFIVNAAGVRDWLRRGLGGREAEEWKPVFRVKASSEGRSWKAEFAIPWSDLGLKSPPVGRAIELKIGRYDASSKPAQADIWPPRAVFGGPADFATVYLGFAPPEAESISEPAVGRAIPLEPGSTIIIEKLLVTDCRAVRGFVGAPVDGSTKSWGWDGQFYEYNLGNDGSGVEYAYRGNDGLHITLAEKEGFNAIQIRGGAKTKIYRDVKKGPGPLTTLRGLTPFSPEGGTLIAELPGGTRDASRVWFDERIATDRVSFFDTTDGFLSDVSFFRLTRAAWDGPPAVPAAMKAERAKGRNETVLACRLENETPLMAMGFDLRCDGTENPAPVTIVLRDPVDSRRDLFYAQFDVTPGAVIPLVLNFPDQICPPGTELRLSLRAHSATTVSATNVRLYVDPRRTCEAEALAYRKLILHGLYSALSEPRPWNGWWSRAGAQDFLASKSPYAPCAQNVLDALDACRYIDKDGKDDEVRQYYEWIWRNVLRKEGKTPPFEAKFDDAPGAPRWAVLAHQAWMQARAVPKWWLDHRLVPTGEFGGEVGDDTDMYGNYADFPMFESDGVGAEIKQAGERLAALADETTMKDGVNIHTMDPLHAYEEGLNHWALMAFWHYGDPVYLERCMDSARSVAALTVVTPKGHRHFRSQEIGLKRLDDPKTDIDGGAHPLMWHPAFEVVRYNNNPLALKWLKEWGDGWLEHNRPGRYAKSVNVATETVVDWDNTPLNGAYGGQGSAFESLYWITGDEKYLKPFFEVWMNRPDRDRSAPGGMIDELYLRGALDSLPEEKRKRVLECDPVAVAVGDDNQTKLEEALKVDVTELQRYPMMYTTVEPFTDRVFLYAITNAAKCYTGGFETRNKTCRTHAVSWEGLGTDFAALVVGARPERLEVMLYNFSGRELKGRMRVWTLDHGLYRLGVITKEPGVEQDRWPMRAENVELARGDAVEITLAPKKVTGVVLVQMKKLDDILDRADLALSPADTKSANGSVESVAHNIGAKAAADVVVALVDEKGAVRQKQSLGPLAAPVDLVPKRIPFRFDRVPADAKGWAVVVDPDNAVTEIYKGNNRVELK